MSARVGRTAVTLHGLLLLSLVTLGPAGVHAQQDLRPFARTSLEPGPTVTVGQPLIIQIEVLVPSFFSGAPGYPDVELRDALVLFVYRGINFTERIDGTTWAGQRREYHVYPQRPGAFEIPAIPVSVRYRAPSGGAGSTAVDTASPPPVRFEATLPPEAEGLDYFISALALELEADFDHRPDTLFVGEAFTRTLTARVEGALSMVIPPLTVDAVQGLASYPAAAEVEDTEGFGVEAMRGRRSEAVTYVAEKEGDFTVPGVELQWWDVNAARLRSVKVPPLELHVVANPDLVAEIPLPVDTLAADVPAGPDRVASFVAMVRRWGPFMLGAGLLIVIALRLYRRFAPRIASAREAARGARAESESAYFRRFQKAARAGDARSAAAALVAWLDRFLGPGATVAAFASAAADEGLTQELERLDVRLYQSGDATSQPWSGAVLLRAVTRARKRVGRQVGVTEPGVGCLRPLNPAGR